MSKELELFFKNLMGDSKILRGWLGGQGENLSLHPSKEEAIKGFKYPDYTLEEIFRDFKNKKIEITIEVIEE